MTDVLTTLLLALLTIGPESPAVTTDHVDILETNHYYDSDGKLVFVQRIYWDWNGEAFEVRDWRLVKECNYPQGKSITWNDSGILRRVTANSVRVTHTQFDPELENRKELGKESRRELTSPRITKQRAQELIEHGRRNDHPHQPHPETP